MVKKKTKHALLILASLFLCALLLFGAGTNIMQAFADGTSGDENVVYDGSALYLSDRNEAATATTPNRIKYATGKETNGNAITRVGSGKLSFNQTDAGKAIQVKIEGAWYTFANGIYAHGPSCVAYNISNVSQQYKYFSAYGGLLSTATKSDGALLMSLIHN